VWAADHDNTRHPEAAQEGWWFSCWWDGGRAGVVTALTLCHSEGLAWYWALLVRPGEPLVHLADLAVPAPSSGLRVRTTGLWADHVCEEPLTQWTVMNEAYAVALDDPADAADRAYGTSVPIACDLEWYASAPPEDGAVPVPGPAGFAQRGEVDGVIELSGGPLHVQATAKRWRWWGKPIWAGAPHAGPWCAPVRLGADLVLDHRLDGTGWQFVLTN
jgi:hypothetical protein